MMSSGAVNLFQTHMVVKLMLEQYRNRIERLGGSVRESLKQQSIEISESLFSNSTSVRDVILDGVHYEA